MTQLAFSRVELLVVLAVIALAAAVAVPALANNRPRSQRVICANNLRQIGVALQVWGNDHGDMVPWHVLPADGGTKLHPLSGNTWYHFAWLSNELTSARILFCPSDVGRPASDFTGDPKWGYLHPNFANQATSYFINAHPELLLVGDRNVRMEGSSFGCSVLAAAWGTRIPVLPTLGWTNGMHETAGNALGTDGSVELMNNDVFRRAVNGVLLNDSATAHFSLPR